MGLSYKPLTIVLDYSVTDNQIDTWVPCPYDVFVASIKFVVPDLDGSQTATLQILDATKTILFYNNLSAQAESGARYDYPSAAGLGYAVKSCNHPTDNTRASGFYVRIGTSGAQTADRTFTVGLTLYTVSGSVRAAGL